MVISIIYYILLFLYRLCFRHTQIVLTINLPQHDSRHFEFRLSQLFISKLPLIAVNTVFFWEDIKKNSYRWAEVNFGIHGIASKEISLLAKQYRDELNWLMIVVMEKDNEGPEDKVDF